MTLWVVTINCTFGKALESILGYVWQAKGQEILKKIQRAHKALARQTNVPPDIKGTLH